MGTDRAEFIPAAEGRFVAIYNRGRPDELQKPVIGWVARKHGWEAAVLDESGWVQSVGELCAELDAQSDDGVSLCVRPPSRTKRDSA